MDKALAGFSTWPASLDFVVGWRRMSNNIVRSHKHVLRECSGALSEVHWASFKGGGGSRLRSRSNSLAGFPVSLLGHRPTADATSQTLGTVTREAISLRVMMTGMSTDLLH